MSLVILKKLEQLCEKYPEMRFCQLVANLTAYEFDFYYVKDEELIRLIDEVIESGW